MFSVGVTTLARLASALMSGDENEIEKLVQRRLDYAGVTLVKSLRGIEPAQLLTAFKAAWRVYRELEIDQTSEVDRKRRLWLNALRPPVFTGSRFLYNFAKAMARTAGEDLSTGESRNKWQGKTWAARRKEWLNNRWMHDWRSQPRNRIGEWIPGRLEFPVSYTLPLSRRLRRLRKRRQQYRKIGRTIGQSVIMSSWGMPNAD